MLRSLKAEQCDFLGEHCAGAGALSKQGFLPCPSIVRDLSEISRGGGGWKQREGHNFLRLRKERGHEKWAVKRGRIMQI